MEGEVKVGVRLGVEEEEFEVEKTSSQQAQQF
jgi:hypothetical protein